MASKLPPLPEEAFDGEHESIIANFVRCSHSKVEFKNGELRCPCGSAWNGPNLHDLYKALHK